MMLRKVKVLVELGRNDSDLESIAIKSTRLMKAMSIDLMIAQVPCVFFSHVLDSHLSLDCNYYK